MGSSARLFNRQRTIHQILGGGPVADIILWRRKNLTLGMLSAILSVWIVFDKSGYTLLSLISSVLLLLLVILFLWSKSAEILNRPAPPVPELYVPEELVNETTAFIRVQTNIILSVSRDIALGRDSRLFFKVAAWLLLVSVIGSLADIVTLAYASVAITMTFPVVYERFEDHIDGYLIMVHTELSQLYDKTEVKIVHVVNGWFLELKKLS